MNILPITIQRIEATLADPNSPDIFGKDHITHAATMDEALSDPNYQLSLPAGPRAFTEEERTLLVGSLPLLGFPLYRMVTQEGPHERRVYSFKRKRILDSTKATPTGDILTQVYSPYVHAGVWVSSREVLNGRWPMIFRSDNPALLSSEAEARKEDMSIAAGGAHRWRVVPEAEGYGLTDQARLYRILPHADGRLTNPRTGQSVPYEVFPVMVNGKYPQVSLRVEPEEKNLKAHVVKFTLRNLYEAVWPDTTPRRAADHHGTTGFHPLFEIDEYFASTEAAIVAKTSGKPSTKKAARKRASTEMATPPANPRVAAAERRAAEAANKLR